MTHVHIALKTKYLYILEAVSLQTDTNEGSGSKRPQMKDHLYCSSVVSGFTEELPKDAQDVALLPSAAAVDTGFRCQEVPLKISTHTYLCRSPGEQNGSPWCSQVANFPLLLRPKFVHKAKKILLRKKEHKWGNTITITEMSVYNVTACKQDVRKLSLHTRTHMCALYFGQQSFFSLLLPSGRTVQCILSL